MTKYKNVRIYDIDKVSVKVCKLELAIIDLTLISLKLTMKSFIENTNYFIFKVFC